MSSTLGFPAGANGGPMGMGLVAVPSQAQRDEVHRVQGLQVRTNAANLATQICAGPGLSQATWTGWAELIEHYIAGE